jgi:hypothetical protein
LKKKHLVWECDKLEQAKQLAIERTTNKIDAEKVLIVIIKSNDWLNKNVKAGDIILH